jgi:hypothetical protein
LLFFAAFGPALAAGADNAPQELAIGENLRLGMPVADAIGLLGLPDSIRVKRGTEARFDAVVIDYPKHGVAIHALTNGKTIEGIEARAVFKGKLASGIKIGDDFKALVQRHGTPKSLGDNLARYPEQELYFVLDKEKIVAMKTFVKDSKLLDNRLANPN